MISKSLIELTKGIHLIYLWSIGTIQKNAVIVQATVLQRFIVDVYHFFKEICAQYLDENPIKLGGKKK